MHLIYAIEALAFLIFFGTSIWIYVGCMRSPKSTYDPETGAYTDIK